MKKPFSSALVSIVLDIEAKKILISQQWVNDKRVVTIFESFGINPKYFQSHFAIPIIEYFISVIKGEKEAGDCPVMSKFVRFMVTKGILPKDVFLVCMVFRKNLIDNVLKMKGVLENLQLILDDIADIFDANLAGVLEIFDAAQSKQIEDTQKIKSYESKIKQIAGILDAIDSNIILLENDRVLLANKNFLKLLNIEDLKSYYLKYKDGADFIIDHSVEHISELLEISQNEHRIKIYNCEKGILQYFFIKAKLTPESEIPNYVLEFVFDEDCRLEIKDDKLALLVADPISGMYKELHIEDNLHLFIEEAKEQNRTLIYTLIDPYNIRLKEDDYYKEQLNVISKIIKNNISQSDYLFQNSDNTFGILQFSKDIDDSNLKSLNLKNKIAKITELYMVRSIVQPKDNAKRLLSRVSKLLKLLQMHNSSNTIFDNEGKNEELNENEYAKKLLLASKIVKSAVFYKEIPIYSDSKINQLKESSTIFATLEKKALGVALANSFIHFKISPELTIRAKISSINEEKSVVVLSDIAFDENSPLRRKSVCVGVDFEFDLIFADKNKMRAKARFLCEDKIGFILEDGFDLEGMLNMYVSFEIDNELIYTKTHIEEKYNNTYVGVLGYNSNQFQVVNDFISKKQIDIIREINRKMS